MPNGNNKILVIREVTTDDRYVATVAPEVASQLQDVVAMKDGKEIARWPWFYSNKPSRGTSSVTINCAVHPAKWA